MNFQQKRVAWWMCAALLVPGLAPAPRYIEAAQPWPSRARPKLVVLLVVDQMRADYIDKFQHQWTGGLRRLIDGGAWFRQAAYPYLSTVTCAGHATISTGTFPATHGMVLNAWWDRESGKGRGCTEDPRSQVISYSAAAKGGHSPVRLAVPTFADELRAQMGPSSRIVILSLKPRSAIMLAGQRADVVTWFDTGAGSWVTSLAYTTSPVSFLEKFLQAHPVEKDFGKSWSRTLPDRAYLFEDNAADEKPPPGWTAIFPHGLKGQSNEPAQNQATGIPSESLAGKPDIGFYEAWVESPFSDAYLGRMAQAAVDALGLGKGRGTDFLGVGFSALDFVGHDFGPRSHEVQDMLVRLDATVGALLSHLDRAVGPGNYVVALSADHGVAPIPEQMSREGLDAGRIVTNQVVERVEQALEPLFGPGKPAKNQSDSISRGSLAGKHVARMLYTDFYFAPGVYQKLAADSAAMQAAMDAILAVPGVWRVFRGDELGDLRDTGDRVARAAALSYYPGRSGDLIVVPKPYWFFVLASEELPPGPAATHGTAYAYDARVPLILMGRGIKPGEYLVPATPADIAPTLAFLCGITLARTDGRVLAEALVARPPAESHSPQQ